MAFGFNIREVLCYAVLLPCMVGVTASRVLLDWLRR